MERIDKLPWYDNYMLILEWRRVAEKEIENLENPEKQFQRVKNFYHDLGADYFKNQLLSRVEEDLTFSNKGENSRLSQLKREVKIGTVMENAVKNQDDVSIAALNVYKEDDLYKKVVKQIMFFIGVSKVKKEPEFIKKAYDAIYKTYPLDRTALFGEEGVYYYLYYFQCIQSCIRRYKNQPSFEDVKMKVKERCYNAKLMFAKYQSDMYISDEVGRILSEIIEVEKLLEEPDYDKNQVNE